MADPRRMCNRFYSLIGSGAGQIYSTALPWMPACALQSQPEASSLRLPLQMSRGDALGVLAQSLSHHYWPPHGITYLLEAIRLQREALELHTTGDLDHEGPFIGLVITAQWVPNDPTITIRFVREFLEHCHPGRSDAENLFACEKLANYLHYGHRRTEYWGWKDTGEALKFCLARRLHQRAVAIQDLASCRINAAINWRRLAQRHGFSPELETVKDALYLLYMIPAGTQTTRKVHLPDNISSSRVLLRVVSTGRGVIAVDSARGGSVVICRRHQAASSRPAILL